MKIILDAWFDNNFGDDLFINTVLNRYPEDEFYVFWERVHPAVLDQAKGYSQLKILPGNCIENGRPGCYNGKKTQEEIPCLII